MLRRYRTSQFLRKSTLNIHWKDWCWSWKSNTWATWCKEPTQWRRPWCWERLKAGEGDDRGWDGWMASPTQWAWVWVNSGRWWKTRKPGVPWSPGVTKSRTRLSDRTTTITIVYYLNFWITTQGAGTQAEPPQLGALWIEGPKLGKWGNNSS